MRTKLALLAAVILGFLAAIGVRHYVEQKETELKGTARRAAIAVAREDIGRGVVLREHMIKPVEVEEIAIGAMNILYDQRRPWIGQTVAVKVKAGEPLMKTHFTMVDTVDSPMNRKIEPGWRAITLAADQISGVAGLITPGSHVDILGTFREQAGGPNVAASVVTKVIARNVEVLAVDNRTDITLPARGAAGRVQATDRGYSSITLHVTALEASLLTFAQGAGKLTFALRRLDDLGSKDPVPDITQPQLPEIISAAARQRELLLQQQKSTATPP